MNQNGFDDPMIFLTRLSGNDTAVTSCGVQILLAHRTGGEKACDLVLQV